MKPVPIAQCAVCLHLLRDNECLRAEDGCCYCVGCYPRQPSVWEWFVQRLRQFNQFFCFGRHL